MTGCGVHRAKPVPKRGGVDGEPIRMPSQHRIEWTHFKQEFALEHRTVHRQADMSLGQKLVETPRRHPLCAVAAKEPKIAFAVLAKTELAGAAETIR